MNIANAETENLYQKHLSDWEQTLERFVDDQGRTDFIELEKDTSQRQKFVDAVGKEAPKLTLIFSRARRTSLRITSILIMR